MSNSFTVRLLRGGESIQTSYCEGTTIGDVLSGTGWDYPKVLSVNNEYIISIDSEESLSVCNAKGGGEALNISYKTANTLGEVVKIFKSSPNNIKVPKTNHDGSGFLNEIQGASNAIKTTNTSDLLDYMDHNANISNQGPNNTETDDIVQDYTAFPEDSNYNAGLENNNNNINIDNDYATTTEFKDNIIEENNQNNVNTNNDVNGNIANDYSLDGNYGDNNYEYNSSSQNDQDAAFSTITNSDTSGALGGGGNAFTSDNTAGFATEYNSNSQNSLNNIAVNNVQINEDNNEEVNYSNNIDINNVDTNNNNNQNEFGNTTTIEDNNVFSSFQGEIDINNNSSNQNNVINNANLQSNVNLKITGPELGEAFMEENACNCQKTVGQLINEYETWTGFPMQITVNGNLVITIHSDKPRITVGNNSDNTEQTLPYNRYRTIGAIMQIYDAKVQNVFQQNNQNNINNINAANDQILNQNNYPINYDYNDADAEYDNVNVHAEDLKRGIIGILDAGFVGEPRTITVNTTQHSDLVYQVTIERTGNNLKVSVCGPKSTPGNTRYANVVNILCRDKLMGEYTGSLTYETTDVACLTSAEIEGSEEFKLIEGILKNLEDNDLEGDISADPLDTKGDPIIIKCVNLDQVIEKLNQSELRRTLEVLKAKGYKQMVVWRDDHFTRFDVVGRAGKIDLYDVIGYDKGRLDHEVQFEKNVQVIENIQETNQTINNEAPTTAKQKNELKMTRQTEMVVKPIKRYVPPKDYQKLERSYFAEINDGNGEEEGEVEMVFDGNTTPRTMQRTFEPQLGIFRRNYRMPTLENTQDDVFNDVDTSGLEENNGEETPEPNDEEEITPSREFNVRVRPEVRQRDGNAMERDGTQNFFNIKTVEGGNSAPGTATQNIRPAETTTRQETQGSVTDPRQPVVVLSNPGQVMASPDSAPTAKGEGVRVDINHDPIREESKVHIEHDPIREESKVHIEHDPIVENSKIVIDHQDILDELKALVEQQGRNQSQALKDVIDNIKVEIEHEPIASQQIKLYEKLLIEMEQLKEKTNIDIDINDDDLRQEIAELRKQISGLKGENISIELNHLEDVNQKLELIAEKLNGIQNNNDAIQVVIDANDEMQRLKEERNDIIEISPDFQELSDKITVLIDNKLQGLNINDKLEIHQPDINIEQPEVVVEQPDLSELTKSVNELKGLIAKVEDNVKIQIEQKMKELQEQDVQVIIQEEPKEIIVDKPTKKEENQIVVTNEFVENKPDVNKEITVTNEFEAMEPQDKEIVIEIPAEVEPKNEQVEVVNEFKNMEPKVDNVMVTNEFEKVEPKVEETQIVNEFEPVEPKKQTEIVQEYEVNRAPVIAQGPIPMQGFMAAPMMPMMMPPVFMPPPMPMPAPQPQQPIIITQNQSDEEEGNSFWSNFWKILLILLLIASLIGVGLLLWKNMQKTNDRANDQKPDKKPEPDKKPDPKPEPEKAEEVIIKPDKPVDQGPIKTSEGQTAQPVCEDGKNLQLNVNAEKVSLGADAGALTSDAKNAINLENAGTHNKLIAADGTTIDTRRIEITGNQISARDWNGSLSNAKTYTGTIQDGQAVINGKTYTIANESGQAYSSGAIDVASQTSYTRNSDQTLSTNFGTLKQDLQINKNNTFTLNTNTENGTTISSNTVDDISNNATMQDILKNKLNDSNLTKGEYNRIMDALDNGKLDDSYFQTINNGATGYSLDNSNNIGNGAGY